MIIKRSFKYLYELGMFMLYAMTQNNQDVSRIADNTLDHHAFTAVLQQSFTRIPCLLPVNILSG